MDMAFELLMVASMLGGIDVLYFHIYKFRLYENPASVAEEVTHLARGLIFILIVLIIMFTDGSAWARWVLLGLVVLDLANSVVDVLLERASRESLGGLPSGEYLIHILGTFLTGLAVATVWWHSSSAGFTPVTSSSWNVTRAVVTIGFGSLMFLVESGLFIKALRARAAQQAPVPLPQA